MIDKENKVDEEPLEQYDNTVFEEDRPRSQFDRSSSGNSDESWRTPSQQSNNNVSKQETLPPIEYLDRFSALPAKSYNYKRTGKSYTSNNNTSSHSQNKSSINKSTSEVKSVLFRDMEYKVVVNRVEVVVTTYLGKMTEIQLMKVFPYIDVGTFKEPGWADLEDEVKKQMHKKARLGQLEIGSVIYQSKGMKIDHRIIGCLLARIPSWTDLDRRTLLLRAIRNMFIEYDRCKDQIQGLAIPWLVQGLPKSRTNAPLLYQQQLDRPNKKQLLKFQEEQQKQGLKDVADLTLHAIIQCIGNIKTQQTKLKRIVFYSGNAHRFQAMVAALHHRIQIMFAKKVIQ